MIFFGHIGITLLLVFLLFGFLKEKIDYRFLVVGSILPDLIDKPIGHYLFYSTFMNGRIFAHTVLFVLLLTIVAFGFERRYRFTGVSVLAIGALAHIVEDQMWRAPSTALWPLMGWQFPKLDLQNYTGYIFDELLHDPGAYVPEIIGIVIIAWFIYRFELYSPEKIKSFLITGSPVKAKKASNA
jgi:inner membrane protein